MLKLLQKKFLKYKKKIVTLLIIFALILIFWQYTTIRNTSTTVYEKSIAPVQYEELIQKIDIKNPTTLHKTEIFITKNHNIYGTLASMHLAKIYVLNKNFNAAIIQLQNSLKYTEEENLNNLLKLKIIKIKIEQNQINTALTILNSITNSDWKNILQNIKGDLLFKKNNLKEAIEAWKKSSLLEDSPISKQMIDIKIKEANQK